MRRTRRAPPPTLRVTHGLSRPPRRDALHPVVSSIGTFFKAHFRHNATLCSQVAEGSQI